MSLFTSIIFLLLSLGLLDALRLDDNPIRRTVLSNLHLPQPLRQRISIIIEGLILIRLTRPSYSVSSILEPLAYAYEGGTTPYAEGGVRWFVVVTLWMFPATCLGGSGDVQVFQAWSAEAIFRRILQSDEMNWLLFQNPVAGGLVTYGVFGITYQYYDSRHHTFSIPNTVGINSHDLACSMYMNTITSGFGHDFNSILATNRALHSPNKKFKLTIESCNLVLLPANSPNVLWASYTFEYGGQCFLQVKFNGNMVLHSMRGGVIWSTNFLIPNKLVQSILGVTDDASLHLYREKTMVWHI